ncbi:MAG: 4-hydroxy-tetrahydrodipicolinate synthase, partial [Deltaproteobacteria bacterium]
MNPFKGIYTALITPFKNHKPILSIDEPSLRSFIDWQIEEGVDGFVACGTTGESATLSHEEKKQVIEIVIKQAKNRVPVIAGTGTNNTADSHELTAWAKKQGASAALIVTPYYNKPSQEGLYRHFEAISKIGLPLILYNVPGRTAVSLTPQTIGRLSKIENIVAIKEATGSLSFASEVLQETQGKMSLISGDDFTFLPLLSLGAD